MTDPIATSAASTSPGRRILTGFHSIEDLRLAARRRLPGPIFDVLDRGAETGLTKARNTSDFDRWSIAPRCLTDVSRLDTAISVLGQQAAWPVICSPVGGLKMFDPGGECAAARAAARSGTAFCVSTASSFSIEEIAVQGHGPRIFQLYMCRDRDLNLSLIERARRNGYGALCVTVDTPAIGRCEAELRSRIFAPVRNWPVSTFAWFAAKPVWAMRQLSCGPVRAANFTDEAGRAFTSARFASLIDPTIGWADIRSIADAWRGPLAVKGVMRPDDARRAVDAGATAIIVSNHGGRQLDGALSPIDAVAGIASAVGAEAEVILDGGVRRGVHVLKALARGAKACLVGRAYVYGLAAGGEAGVETALDILRSEFELAMKLAGCATLAAIDSDIIGNHS